MKKIVIAILSVVLLTGVFAGCGESKSSLVVTTIPPLEYYLTELMGDWVEVKSIVPVGVDPFTYQITDEDKKLISEAEFVVVNGGDIDGWIEENLNGKETYNLLNSATERGLTTYTEKTPFVFLDINAMREMALVLAPVLEEKVETAFGVQSAAYSMEVALATHEDNWWNRFRKHNGKSFAGMTNAWEDIAKRMGVVYTGEVDTETEFFVFEPEIELQPEVSEVPGASISVYDFKSEEKTYTNFIDSVLKSLFAAFEAN